MYDKLLKHCYNFESFSSELNQEVLKFEKEYGAQFSDPSSQDKEDFQILVRRALKGNLRDLLRCLVLLDELARQFKHESYTHEFYDFISDQDLFDWVHSVKNKDKLSEFDTGYLQYIIEDLKGFSTGNIFK